MNVASLPTTSTDGFVNEAVGGRSWTTNAPPRPAVSVAPMSLVTRTRGSSGPAVP